MHDVQRPAVKVLEAVGVCQRFEHSVANVHGDPERKPSTRVRDGATQLGEVDPVDELQGHVWDPVDLAVVERLHDVRVVEKGGDPRFFEEHAADCVVLEGGGADSLEYTRLDETRGTHLTCEVDLRHSSGAHHAHELVPAEDPDSAIASLILYLGSARRRRFAPATRRPLWSDVRVENTAKTLRKF